MKIRRPAVDAERHHHHGIDLAVRPDLHPALLGRRVLADRVDPRGDVEHPFLLDRLLLGVAAAAPGIGAPGPDRPQRADVDLRAVAEVLPLLGGVGGDGELGAQVAVADRLEGERAVAVVGEEEAGDAAEEVAQLPAVLELLVLPARLGDGGRPGQEGQDAGEQDPTCRLRPGFHPRPFTTETPRPARRRAIRLPLRVSLLFQSPPSRISRILAVSSRPLNGFLRRLASPPRFDPSVRPAG